MAETKLLNQINETKAPSENLSLGFEVVINRECRHQSDQNPQIPGHELEGTVKRIIAHLKDENKKV
jgi:hypothetical protein